MARDLSFGSHCYGAAADDAMLMMPRAMDARARALSSQELDDALGQVADASTPRAPVDVLLPFLRVNYDDQRQPKPYGGAVWVYPNQKEEAEQERVWVDDDHAYHSDATLAIEGDYT
jgi:hypothetical protein